MGKCTVGFRHTVRILTLLNRTALALAGIHKFAREALYHRDSLA